MSCAATRQGDEMYCSRCRLRWEADGEQTVACLPEIRRKRTPAAVKSGFDARAIVMKHRRWVSNSGVLDIMETVAAEAYAAGVKDGGK